MLFLGWVITHDLGLTLAMYLRPFLPRLATYLEGKKAIVPEPSDYRLHMLDEEVDRALIKCAYDKGLNDAKTKFEAMLKDHESNGYRITAFSACGKCSKLCTFCIESPVNEEAEQLMDREMASLVQGTNVKKPLKQRN